MSISQRKLILILCLAVVGLAGAGTWFYFSEERQLRRNAEAALQAIADLKVNQISEWREERLGDAAVIMESPFLNEAVVQWLSNPRREIAEKILKRFGSYKAHYRYMNVMLVDRNGKVRLTLDPHTDSLAEEAAGALSQALREQRPVLTDLHESMVGIPPHVDVIAPLLPTKASEHESAVAVIAQMDATQLLYPLIQYWPTPSHSAETLLVRRDGDDALFLNELRHRKNTALKLRISLTEKNVPAVMAIDGRRDVVQGLDYRGVEVLAVLKAVPDTPWFMIAKVDKEEALAVWRSKSFLIVTVLVAFMFSFTAVCGVIWERNAKVGYRKLYQAETSLRKAEERHRVTLLSVGDGVIVTDAEGRVELVNHVAEKLTGWRHEEAYAKPLEEVLRIFNEETGRPVDNPVSKVLANGLVIGLANHTMLISKDGIKRPIADSGAPIRDESGSITGVVLVFRDQTEERASQNLILQERARAQQYLDLAGTMLIGLDTAGIVRLVNRKGCEILGYREQELVGKNWFEQFVPDEDVDGFNGTFTAIVQGRKDLNTYAESSVRTRNGEARLIAWHNSLVKDQDGSIMGTLSSGEDITDRRKAEEALRKSETLYRTTFNDASVGIDLVDRDGRFLEANNTLETFLGYTREELSKLSILDVTHPADVVRTGELHQALVRGEMEAYRLEKRYVRKDGTVLWADTSVSTVRDADGTYRATVGVIVDINQRKESEAAYLRLATAVEQAAETIEITDARGIIVYVNPAFERTTGYSYREAVGRNPRLLKSGRHDDGFYRALWQTIAGGKVWSGRFQNKKKDGTVFHEDASISPVKDESGNIVNFVAVKRDVTQELLLEKQLKQAQKLESIAALAGGIAHDFNNLLTIASGYTELLLLENGADGPGHQELKSIQHALARGAELVKRILTFSRQIETFPRVLNLNEEIQQAERLLIRTIPKMIDIELDLADDLQRVSADPGQIEQVLLNLAINARDAMPEGGKLVLATRNVHLDEDYCRVHVDVQEGDYVMLEVSDTGHGMDSETVERIFEPFYSTKKPGKGTGLGLAMVFGIVKGHNGHVQCYSEPGQGTAFKIYIPAIQEMEAEREVSSTQQFESFGSETVLLIDDEELIRDLGTKILTRAGYTVLTASNGYEGLEIYRKRQEEIGLVLLDMLMPGMGGGQCLQELLSINPDVKVAIASGFSLHRQTRAVLESGVKGFMNKPFRVSEVLRTVRKILDEKSPPETPETPERQA